MAIEHTVSVVGGTLVVRATGFDESVEEVMAYGAAVIEAAIGAGVERVLCDERDLEYRLDVLDTYQIAEVLAKRVPTMARVAIVCHRRHASEAQFFEDVVVNRAMTLRMFTEVSEAMRWLGSRDDDSPRGDSAAAPSRLEADDSP